MEFAGPLSLSKRKLTGLVLNYMDLFQIKHLFVSKLSFQTCLDILPRKCVKKQSRYRPGVAQRVPGS
jgi:hypothetical protein